MNRKTTLRALFGLWVGTCVALGLYLTLATAAQQPERYKIIQAKPHGGGWAARLAP